MPAAAEELQELLLTREEVLTIQEEKARISEKSLSKVSADLDAEWAKAKATRKEYIDKMETHTARAKHSLGLDKMLGEKKVKLNIREQDLELRGEALAEVQARGLNP